MDARWAAGARRALDRGAADRRLAADTNGGRCGTVDEKAGKRESPRVRAARYRAAVSSRAHPETADPAGADWSAGVDMPDEAGGSDEAQEPGATSRAGRANGAGAAPDDGTPPILPTDEAYEIANKRIDAAVARGDFDNLAYAGKPIPNLGGTSDPDWWLKGLIEREKLTGLGPPALLLRTENVELDGRLDRLFSEREVREALEDFNGRVVEARRQLLGGPPVITPTRDVEAELRRWHERRAPAAAPPSPAEGDAPASWWKRCLRWWERRSGASRRPS